MISNRQKCHIPFLKNHIKSDSDPFCYSWQKILSQSLSRKNGPISVLEFAQIPQGFCYPKVGRHLFLVNCGCHSLGSMPVPVDPFQDLWLFCSVLSLNRRFVGAPGPCIALRVQAPSAHLPIRVLSTQRTWVEVGYGPCHLKYP